MTKQTKEVQTYILFDKHNVQVGIHVQYLFAIINALINAMNVRACGYFYVHVTRAHVHRKGKKDRAMYVYNLLAGLGIGEFYF